ncbi:MAG TPA: hypothetical protein VFG54_22105, partial [Prolixibacteraceae bacterium]|nr:hypothetical protein [Prolixibacteraceae bacterium]
PLQYYNSEKLDRKFKSYLKGMDENSIQKLSAEERDFGVEVRFVNAALWLMSRRCIETVGLFAPIFDHYGEDQNYAHRCKFHKFKMGVYLKAIGYHEREQVPVREKNTSVKKLLVRDKHLCLTILMNLKHSYSRQWLFFIFTLFRELFKNILLLKFKTVMVILYRFNFIVSISKLKDQRKLTKKTGAFLKPMIF